MSWWVESRVLDEEDSAGLLQDNFENHFRNMFFKCDSYKIYYMHAQF